MKIFLAAVSSQFKDCRDRLRSDLSAKGCQVCVQEDFPQGPRTLIEWLEQQVAHCDRVIAVVGDAYGSEPPSAAVPPAAPRRSHTQREYAFARGERLNGTRAPRKDIYLYFASGQFLAEHSIDQPEEHVERQRAFREQIEATGEHRKTFDNVDHLRAEVLRDWPERVRTEPPRRASLGDRQAERRYLERVIDQHRHVQVPGRAKPLDLERIYISLLVGEFVPPEERPDQPSRRESAAAQQRTGIVSATEALAFKRLAVLGAPGSGKTTLLQYVALRIAQRDPALEEWAREVMPHGWAHAIDRVITRLNGFPAQGLGLLLGIAGLGMWVVGAWNSSSVLWAAITGVVLTGALLAIFSRRATRAWALEAALLLIGSAYVRLVPPWAWGCMAVVLVVLLYPYWIARPLAGLRRLRRRWTPYPLPVYVTLNNVAVSGETLRTNLAQELAAANFADPKGALARKLDDGTCVILLDALDEVVEEPAFRRVSEEIARLARDHERVPVVVTCRTAGFRDQRTVLRGFHRLEVQEFTETETAQYIRHWFADLPPDLARTRVDGLVQGLGRSARMRQLSTNPLLLSLVCLNYERDLRLPERRVELYDRFADELLEQRERDHGLAGQARFEADTKRQVLQAVARGFHEQGLRLFGETALVDAIDTTLTALGYNAARGRECLQEVMERTGLVRQQSRTSYSFAHLTFQEFFAAEQFRRQAGQDALLAHVGDPWWREVILLYTGLAADSTELIRRLKAGDLLLAADALADAGVPGTPAFRSLAQEIGGALQRLVEEDSERRQEAADALAALGRWGGTEFLVARAESDRQPEVVLAALLALERAGDRTELARLCEPLGPRLQLLTAKLGRFGGAVDQRILSLLNRLGLELIAIPAGEFTMGDETFADERPRHPVRLDDYWIGKYPVTNALFQKFATETGFRAADAWPKDFQPGKARHPATYVNLQDARQFCKWSGTALPSEAEWEKAARGTDGRQYPWGNAWDASRCNLSGRGTTAVDAHPTGASSYGCFDLCGNVDDWTRSLKKPYPYDPADGREDLTSSGARVVRGGSFGDSVSAVRAAFRYHHAQDNRSPGVGFRVVVSRSCS